VEEEVVVDNYIPPAEAEALNLEAAEVENFHYLNPDCEMSNISLLGNCFGCSNIGCI
jgi:hypothetical protein